MKLLFFLLIISSLGFSQNLKDINLNCAIPEIVDSGLTSLTTNFNCNQEIKFGTIRQENVFPWCNPGFTVDGISGVFLPSPSRSVKIYKNGVLWVDIPYTTSGQALPNTGGYLDVTATYTYELCDNVNGGSFPFVVRDVTDESELISGTFVIPSGGGCASVNIGPLNGVYTFSGDGVTNLGNGTGVFNSSVAGVGTHTITYSFDNGRGCTGTDIKTVTVNGPSVDAGINISICKGEPISIGNSSTVTGGMGTIIYNWNSSINANTSNLQIFTAIADTTETYYFSVTDENGLGCTVTDSILVTAYELPNISLSPSNFGICAKDSTTITATYINGSGTINYASLNGDTVLLSNYTNNSAIFSATQSGNYQINMIVSDNNLCSDTASTYITVKENPTIHLDSIKNVMCYGDSTAEIYTSSITGNSPFTFMLNNDTNLTGVFTDLSSGNYNLKIVDDNLCKADTQIFISQKDSMIINYISKDESCGNKNGFISVNVQGGTPNYSYFLNGFSVDTNYIDSLQQATYYLKVIDSCLCQKQISIDIGGSPEMAFNIDSITTPKCYNFSNASILASVSSGIPNYSSYLYKNNILTDSLTFNDSIISYQNLNSGYYSIIVKDSDNCSSTIDSIYISQPDSLIITNSFSNDVTCFNSSDGEINVEVNGGSIPYKYYWNNLLGPENIQNKPVGKYILRVEDFNNCYLTDTFNISGPSEIEINDTIFYQNNLGTILISANGGTPNYNYNWSNGETINTNENLPSGNYFVTVTDANNCEIIKDYTIELPLIIPNVITPNTDGFNDTWKIQNIEAYGKISIKIFNRWGDIVFTYNGSAYNNVDNQWDGKYMGKKLPLGTYLYILELNSDDVRNGTITIIR